MIKEILKKNHYLFLKLKEIKNIINNLLFDVSFRLSLLKFVKSRNKKPFLVILKELKLIRKYWKCYPLHYYKYQLYRKELDIDSILNYIPEFFFYSLFLPYHNKKEIVELYNDKEKQEATFREYKIPHLDSIFIIIDGEILNSKSKKINFNDMHKELDSKKIEKLFLKPISGKGGQGIYIFYREDGCYYEIKTKVKLNENFLERITNNKNFLVQGKLKQDKQISEIYPFSINTLRIVTENKNGRIKILTALLRMGRWGNEIDNFSQGGLIIKVNIEDGSFEKQAFSKFGDCFTKHPDSNFIFKNRKIKKWEVICDFLNVHTKKIDNLTYIGWDIALTEDGPLVIEVNTDFGIDGYQTGYGGLREIYGIENPDLYWYIPREKSFF